MFNPYVEEPERALQPVPGKKGLLDGLLGRLSRLDTDDLLILLLVYLITKEGEEDSVWPLAAALLYLML